MAVKRFLRSDRIESALLAGFAGGSLSGAGVLVWWFPACLILIFAGLFRKYAFYTAAAASAAGFLLAFYYAESYDNRGLSISENNYCCGSFRICLKDSRQCSVKNIGQPAMLNAELLGYKLETSEKAVACKHKVMVRLPENMAVPEYGSIIRGYGNIYLSSDPGFSNYLKARDIVKCIYLREASVSGSADSTMKFILSVRDKIAERVLEYIGDDRSRNLAAALFFGITGGFKSDLRSVYADTGTIHIFSVSGMHVAVLAYFLFLFFRIAGMRYGYLLTLFFTGFYVVSTGASAPAARAYFMLCIWGASRVYLMWMKPFSVFCWASFLLLLANPLLVLDVGARYSIVITGVLVAVTEMFSVYREKSRRLKRYLVPGGKVERRSFLSANLFKLKLSLYICTAAFAGGLAISLHHNGQFLLFSILVNLLLAPFMSLFYLLLGAAVIFPPSGVMLSLAFQLLHGFCSWVLPRLCTQDGYPKKI